MKNTKFYSYLFNNKLMTIGFLLLIGLASIFAQLTPYLQGLFVDIAIIPQNEVAITQICIIFALILILDTISKYILSRVSTDWGYSVSKKIRKDVFINTINKPFNFFELERNGDILQKTNNYIYNIGNFISKDVSEFAIGIERFIIIFVFIFVLNIKLALVLAGLYLAILIFIVLFSKYMFKLGKEYKKLELHRNSLILQNLEGMETYLAYNDNFDYLKNYKRINKEYDDIRFKYYWFYNAFDPLIDFLACLGTVIIYHLSIGFMFGILEVGLVVAMLGYASKIISPMQMISNGLTKIFEIKSTIDKVFENDDDNKQVNKKTFNETKIDIKCEKVCYENKVKNSQITNLNLEIPFGEKLLIYGKYGVGKTAFSYILTGLYEIDRGNIYFNKTNIKKIDKKSINQIISLASDEVGIFKASLYQNVRFANKNATSKEIENAIKKAGLLKLVNSLPNKEKTIISETTISEGDKQLIAFARLILKNSPIIILDEFARDLDEKQKQEFFKKLQEFTVDKTLIYISQDKNINFKFTNQVNFANLD